MVILKNSVYNAVVEDINQFKGLSKHCKEYIQQKYPDISPFTLGSILSTQVQCKMKGTYRKSPGLNKKYYEEYRKCKENGEPPGVILRGQIIEARSVPANPTIGDFTFDYRMSTHHNISPSLLSRSILQHLYESNKSYSSMLKDTTLIEDRELAHEVHMTNLFDNEYGVFGNTIKQCIGQEHEQKLEIYLKTLNISYIDENILRKKGYDKTPDFKLIIPIAVDGFVINWIESKALFGDNMSHTGYLKDQYLCYWNRFGPGLVIYWFGYLEDIDTTPEVNKMMIIRDHFPKPESLTFMNPSLLET